MTATVSQPTTKEAVALQTHDLTRDQSHDQTPCRSVEQPLLLPFTDLRCRQVELAGGKGASLASMTAEGLPVPPGFVVTAAAFAAAVDQEVLRAAMRRKDVDAARALVAAAEAPRELITAAFGELTWLEGAVCGLASPVIAEEGTVLTLAEMPPEMPPLPLRVRLVEGCDKQLATCSARFSNALNFRGEAHLPGNDLLTRYPGG